MFNFRQQTISTKVEIKGIGLHSGKVSRVRHASQGKLWNYFQRTDLKENNIIKANYKNVSSAILCTTLENIYGIKVSTIEHLLAAFL